jgi:hypothetical protein
MKYGCHCELDFDQKPDECVIDHPNYNRHDCVHAQTGVKKEECPYWKPIKSLLKISKIVVSESCDGFSIDMLNKYGDEISDKSYQYNQEESIKDIIEVFKDLGFDAEYRENY